MRKSFGSASLRLGSKLGLPNSSYSTGPSTLFRASTVLPIITNNVRIPQHLQFSTLQSSSRTTSPPKVKPWLDKTRTVEGRVQEIINASKLHPADFYDAAMQDLVKKCCQLGNLEGMQLAQDVLDRLLVEKRRLQATGIMISVPVDLVQTLLYGWAVLASTLRVAQNRMREVLQVAIEEAKQDDLMINKATETITLSEANSHQPTVDLFNTYLRGLANAAKHQQPQAALNAEAMLYEMAEYNRSLGWHTKPNTRSYTHVIHAFANTRHPGSGQRAYNLLRKMQVVHSIEKEAYLQDYGVPYNVQNPAANKRHIITPDAAVYTSTMKALINSPKGPEKAIDLLNEAIQSEGVRLDEGLFTITMKSLTSMIEVENNAKQRIKLAKQAEDILLMMTKYAANDDFIDDKNDNEPTFQTDRSRPLLSGYNACMDAWARSYCREAAPRCESMLQEMINGDIVVPNTISFNTCLYAWSRAHKFHADAAQRAQELLKHQMKLSTPDQLGYSAKPDFQSFTICILTQADSESPEKVHHARSLLDKLLEHVACGNLTVTRNPTAPFSAVLSVIARSSLNTNDSSVSSEDEFNSMVDTHTDPYSIAISVYRELKSDVHNIGTSVDHHAISAFLRCIAAHCAPGSVERENAARMAFEDACQAGQVSRSVIQALKVALGDTAQSIPQLHSKSPPKFWSRNISAASV